MTLPEGGWISRFRECKWRGKRLSYFLIIFFLFGLLVNSIVLITLQVQSKRILVESNRDEIIINLTDKIDRLISFLHSPPNGTLAPTTTTTTTASQNFTSAQTEKSTLPSGETNTTSILTTIENPNLTTQYSYATSTTEQTNEETLPVSQNATIPSFTPELSTSETEPDTTSTTKDETNLTSTLTDSNTNPMTTLSSETTYTSTSTYQSTTNASTTSSFISTTDFTNPDSSTLNNSNIATSTIQNPVDDSSPFTNTHTGKTSEDVFSTEMEMTATNIFSTTTEYQTTNYSLTDETTYYTYTTDTVTDTTTPFFTTSSTPGKPKKRPYLMLRDLHRLPIQHMCVRYCRNPPIIKSNMTITLNIGGSTEFFEAYVLDSSFQPLPALEKVSYFALEALYPSSIDDVEIPEDLSHETLECSTTPIDTEVKCTKK